MGLRRNGNGLALAHNRSLNKRFHGFFRHLESGHNKLADRIKYMGNTAEELSTVSHVSVHL